MMVFPPPSRLKQISLDRSADEGAGCQLQASHPGHAAAAVAQASRTSARPAAEEATASAAIATITFTLVTTSSDPLVSSGPEVAVVLEDPLEVFLRCVFQGHIWGLTHQHETQGNART